MREEIIGNARLILGDCREVLPTLSGVDAVVTDPPYGISYSHGKGGGKLARSTSFANVTIIGDNEPFNPLPWLRFKDVVLWGANHFADRLPPASAWLVWDKRDGICSNDQSDCELAWTNFGTPARLIRHLWNGMLKASERGEVRSHPTQKPIRLMEWCIEFIPSFEMIIDPFMGTGATGIACIRLGRSFTGIEIHEPYFDIACRRIEQAYRQRDLFVDAPVPIDPADQRAADLFAEPS